ncbi:MAG: hypothetical protein QM713_05435 [Arachnia sp.]
MIQHADDHTPLERPEVVTLVESMTLVEGTDGTWRVSLRRNESKKC